MGGAQTSLDFAERSWSTAVRTIQFTARSDLRQTLALLEKFLSDTDPLFAATLPSSASAAGANSNVRKRKCPVQLHPGHRLLVEAYLMLSEHLVFASTSASASASAGMTQSDLCKAACACMRRVITVLQSVLPPNHPEVSSLQLELAKALRTEILAKKSSGGAGAGSGGKVVLELRRERKDLLTRAVQSRFLCAIRFCVFTSILTTFHSPGRWLLALRTCSLQMQWRSS